MQRDFILVIITVILTGGVVAYFTSGETPRNVPDIEITTRNGEVEMTPSSGDLLGEVFPDKKFVYCVLRPDGDWLTLEVPEDTENPGPTSTPMTRDEYFMANFGIHSGSFSIFENECPRPKNQFGAKPNKDSEGKVLDKVTLNELKASDPDTKYVPCVVRPDGDYLTLVVPETFEVTATSSATNADEYMEMFFPEHIDKHDIYEGKCPLPKQILAVRMEEWMASVFPVFPKAQAAVLYQADICPCTQFISLGNASAFNFQTTTPWTIEFWASTTPAQNAVQAFTKRQSSTPFRGYVIGLGVDNNFKLGARFLNTNTTVELSCQETTTTTSIYTPNVWHHYAITYTGTGVCSGFTFYVDGSNRGSSAVDETLATTMQNSSDAEIWGERNSTGSQGRGDVLIVWNYVRTAAQINSDRFWQPTAEPGVIGLWYFNENNANRFIKDYSVSNVTGTASPGGITKVDSQLPYGE